MLNVVLFRPQIPSNTGNIGRTCLGFGARLHLIRPLGFELTEREVKRAGLDHWERVDLKVHDSWHDFAENVLPGIGHSNVFLVSKQLKLGSRCIADVDFFPRPSPSSSTPLSPPRWTIPPSLKVLPPPSLQPAPPAPPMPTAAMTAAEAAVTREDLAPSSDAGFRSWREGGGGVALIFGNETEGLAGLEESARICVPAVYLPMRDDLIRSYNLSNAVAMALYEVDRQRRIAARR